MYFVQYSESSFAHTVFTSVIGTTIHSVLSSLLYSYIAIEETIARSSSMAAVVLTVWLLVASIFRDCTLAATVINASAIPFEQQRYKFDRQNLCRLLAHKSKSVCSLSLYPVLKLPES